MLGLSSQCVCENVPKEKQGQSYAVFGICMFIIQYCSSIFELERYVSIFEVFLYGMTLKCSFQRPELELICENVRAA